MPKRKVDSKPLKRKRSTVKSSTTNAITNYLKSPTTSQHSATSSTEAGDSTTGVSLLLVTPPNTQQPAPGSPEDPQSDSDDGAVIPIVLDKHVVSLDCTEVVDDFETQYPYPYEPHAGPGAGRDSESEGSSQYHDASTGLIDDEWTFVKVDISENVSALSDLLHNRTRHSTDSEPQLRERVSEPVSELSTFLRKQNIYTPSPGATPGRMFLKPPTPSQAAFRTPARRARNTSALRSTKTVQRHAKHSTNSVSLGPKATGATNYQSLSVQDEDEEEFLITEEDPKLRLDDEDIEQQANFDGYESGGESDTVEQVWTRRGSRKYEIVAAQVLELFSAEGCSVQRHEEMMKEHCKKVQKHHRLSSTYSFTTDKGERGFESHANDLNRESIGLKTETFPPNRNEGRTNFQAPNVLERLFLGKDDKGERQHVCLHAEPYTHAVHTATPDLDSVLISTRVGLGAIRCCFEYYVGRLVSWNINGNLHWTESVFVKRPGEEGPGTKRDIAYKDIPHLYIGKLKDLDRCNVFLMIPGLLEDEAQKGTYVSEQTARAFHDLAFIPAIRQTVEGHRRQYHPMGYDEAKGKAGAGAEIRTKDGTTPDQLTWYSLHPDDLGAIWDFVFDRIKSVPQLSVFKGCFLFMNAKGIKSAEGSKTQGSLWEGLKAIRTKMERILDVDRIGHENIAVDVGFEWCGDYKRSSGKPTVALWKTCCLRRIHRRLMNHCFNGMPGKVRVWNEGMLRDVGTMGIEPPKTSDFYKQGVLYMQWYNTWKAKPDALGVYPFTYRYQSDLAVDAGLWKACTARVRATHVRDFSRIVANYGKTKRRVKGIFTELGTDDFGTRFEVRSLWPVFLELITAAAEKEGVAEKEEKERDNDDDDNYHPAPKTAAKLNILWPQSMWAIESQAWARFLFGRVHAQTSVIEMAAATSPDYGIQMHTIIFNFVSFHFLRHFSNCHLPQYPILSSRDGQPFRDEARFGLNLLYMIKEYGFGYWDVSVDWELFKFLPKNFKGLELLQTRMLGWISADEQIARDMIDRLAICFSAFAEVQSLPDQLSRELGRKRIGSILSHVVLHQWRHDVCSRLELKDEVGGVPRRVEDVRFDRQGVITAFRTVPNWMNGVIKWYAKSGEHLIAWLFSEDTLTPEMIAKAGTLFEENDEWNRTYFPTAFRETFRRIILWLGRYGNDLVAEFELVFHDVFFESVRCVPYPNPTNGGFKYSQTHGKENKGKIQWWYGIPDRKRPGKFVYQGKLKHAHTGWVAPPWPEYINYNASRFETFVRHRHDIVLPDAPKQLPVSISVFERFLDSASEGEGSEVANGEGMDDWEEVEDDGRFETGMY